jgi:septal ring-binding cell division protein DamX
MRLAAFALVAVVALAGCGGDEPDSQSEGFTPRPAPEQPPTDTTVGDTVVTDPADSAVSRAGEAGEPGPAVGRDAAGRTAAGDAAAGAATGAGSSERLYTVQVAAFTESATAVEWARRLSSQDLPVWTSMAELGGRTFYRLRVGAAPTVSETRRLASMISARYEWPVWIAPVTPADRVPDDAVARTRRILQGG